MKLMAQAVGPYDGRLHTEDMLAANKLVRETLADVTARLQGADPSVFRPLEVIAPPVPPHPGGHSLHKTAVEVQMHGPQPHQRHGCC